MQAASGNRRLNTGRADSVACAHRGARRSGWVSSGVFRLRRATVALLAISCLAHPPQADATAPFIGHDAVSPAATCDAAARQAAAESGVPLDVLQAIARVETGRRTVDGVEPWPWAVNHAGKGFWFPSRHEAVSYLEDQLRAGRTNFDVGCFQINYRWHGGAFASLSDMIAPVENARFAAAFLAELRQEFGSWKAAAGAYHSRTPALATAYATRFETMYRRLGALEPEPDHVAERSSPSARPRRFGLVGPAEPLVPGVRFLPGSLVPVGGRAANHLFIKTD